MNFGTQRQMQIYLGGLSGDRPEQPVSLASLREEAREVLDPPAFDYLDGGAGSDDTIRENRRAFERWRIVPRMLRGVDERDLTVTLFGQRFATPLLLGPIGVLSILHPDGEKAAARAAASLDVPYVLSTVSSYTLEEVAEAMGDGTRWFQLYWGRNSEFTVSLLRRAEKAGYSAIVVTVDTMILSWRERDIQHAYLPFLQGAGLANYFSDPAFRDGLEESPEENPTQAILYFAQIFSDASLTWDDLAFLKANTNLPIIVKGVLHPEDARRALDHGAAGIIVSNHGGRQMDGAVAALDMLPEIAESLAGELPVLFDSGIRSGSDVLKALALGAQAVLVGRPYGYGLAVRGAEGVHDVAANLIADVDLSMGLAGCRSVRELDRKLLRRL